MTTLYAFNMTVEVEDEDVLFASAFKHATKIDGLSTEEARELLLVDGEIQVGACITMLLDPGTGPNGLEIVESEALLLTEYE